ncbi:MAG: histone deacetylase, partial [Chloroflexota bacterium]
EKFVYFFPEGHQKHAEPGHPERPDRIEAIKKSLNNFNLWKKYPKLKPSLIPDDVMHNVHYPEYLIALEIASKTGKRFDMDTYITTSSWQLALNAAGGTIAVANSVWEREAMSGFALSRPPGHHATPTRAMGFCLINNIAIAAEYLIQEKKATRIAIIDIDVHHGNGTQDIFWARDDVLFFSVHQSPLYPMTGNKTEVGIKNGEGKTVNIPLPPNAGDMARREAIDTIIIPLLDKFLPEMVLVSVGFDAHWKDPLAHQHASASGYAEIISKINNWATKHCEGKFMLVLEGGYDLEGCSASATCVIQTLLGEEIIDMVGKTPVKETSDWEQSLMEIRSIWQL